MTESDRAALLAAAKAAARDHTNHVARTSAVLEFRQVADPTTIVTLCSELDAAASQHAALHAAIEQLVVTQGYLASLEYTDSYGEGKRDTYDISAQALRQILAAHPTSVERDNRIRAEALESAAQDAYERGDIGKDGGVEAWDWLRGKAQIARDTTEEV